VYLGDRSFALTMDSLAPLVCGHSRSSGGVVVRARRRRIHRRRLWRDTQVGDTGRYLRGVVAWWRFYTFYLYVIVEA
jgi:hypothetical protein